MQTEIDKKKSISFPSNPQNISTVCIYNTLVSPLEWWIKRKLTKKKNGETFYHTLSSNNECLPEYNFSFLKPTTISPLIDLQYPRYSLNDSL